MQIENQSTVLQTLTFGSFPRDIQNFLDLQLYLEQIAFVDFQLQVYVQTEFQGSVFEFNDVESGAPGHSERLNQLAEYLRLVDANYNETAKDFHETLYFSTVLAHLHYLNNEVPELIKTTSLVHINTKQKNSPQKTVVGDFTNYLITRFKVIQGFADEDRASSIWDEYLLLWQPYYFNKSNIAAHRWLDILFERYTYILSMESSRKLDFQTVRQAPFATSNSLLISFCNFLCRHKNKEFVTLLFKKEFGGWLGRILEASILEDSGDFPSASSTDSVRELNSFVENVFEGIGSIPHYYTVLKPSLAKRYVESCMKKTYQSQTVLASFIKTLLDLKEYDEAFAALKTYIGYVEEHRVQNEGKVENILAVIDVYNSCLMAFNPADVFVSRSSDDSKRRFKYIERYEVVHLLLKISDYLVEFLKIIADICQISYTQDPVETKEIHATQKPDYKDLSFLYQRRNLNILASDRSYFVDLISKSWFGVAKLYMYLAIHEASTEKQLEEYTTKILEFHKKALVINSTGNSELLFSYAYTLANTGSLQLATKLCKFILKKFPESFKTWNLLVLLVTLFETHNPDRFSKPTSANEEFQNNTTSSSAVAEEEEEEDKHDGTTELEKLINNALNIAGIFMEKYTDKSSAILLSDETRYQIIQLKLTQLAVQESVHGPNYTLESLPEVFELFHELFYIDTDEVKRHVTKTQNDLKQSSTNNAWSHRPSLIDPKQIHGLSKPKKKLFEIENLSEKFKKLGLGASLNRPARTKSVQKTLDKGSYTLEKRLLQDLWLWASGVYAKTGDVEDAEQCIVEAENINGPNVKTHAYFGFLISKSRKFLSLQEFEKSLESLSSNACGNKKELGLTLLGMSKLFLLDDEPDNSLFLGETDMNAALVRMKNFLEGFSRSWPYGYNNLEVWWYLSLIYERIDDKMMLNKSLWRSIELEDYRPVRDFTVCTSSDFC